MQLGIQTVCRPLGSEKDALNVCGGGGDEGTVERRAACLIGRCLRNHTAPISPP